MDADFIEEVDYKDADIYYFTMFSFVNYLSAKKVNQVVYPR